MRRSPLFAAFAVALAATPALGATGAQPVLRLTDRSPVTVTGRGFEPGESVRVRLASQAQTWTRRATASTTGSFRATFTVSLGRCRSLSLQAFGSKGSRARLFVTAPSPDCSPSD
jgi:hypothetical protein